MRIAKEPIALRTGEEAVTLGAAAASTGKPRPVLAVVALLGLFAGTCGPKAPEISSRKYALECKMMTDDGKALGGVTIDIGRRRVGTTAADGTLKTELWGDEGQLLSVAVSCPEGFMSPEAPSPLRLAHTQRVTLDGYQALHVEAVCRRRVRDIIVVVRARQGAALPLLIEGRPAGTTDADGIAHVLVKADRTTPSLAVSLDTAAHSDLKPINPTRTFELGGTDAILVFDQTFVLSRKRPVSFVPSRQKKRVPYRVD